VKPEKLLPLPQHLYPLCGNAKERELDGKLVDQFVGEQRPETLDLLGCHALSWC